jgi:hypothetical protein
LSQENRLGDIAVAIVVHGEGVCRSSAQHHRDWVIQRKAEIAEEERRKEAALRGSSRVPCRCRTAEAGFQDWADWGVEPS